MSRSASRAPGTGPATAGASRAGTTAGTCAAATRIAASAVGTRRGSTAGITIAGGSISRVAGCPVPHRSVPVRATRSIRVRGIWIALIGIAPISSRTCSHLPVARLLVAHLPLASVSGCSAVLGSIALRASGGACSLLRLSTRRSATACRASLAHRRYTRHCTRCCKYHKRSSDRQVCFLLSFLHNKLT